MYFELHAYQHHVFMDWRFVDDEKWVDVHNALNGGGVESIQAKRDEMFGVKEGEDDQTKDVVKKQRKKVAGKKKKVVSSKKVETSIKKSAKEVKKKKITKTVDKD